jgi:hypothetical protein
MIFIVDLVVPIIIEQPIELIVPRVVLAPSTIVLFQVKEELDSTENRTVVLVSINNKYIKNIFYNNKGCTRGRNDFILVNYKSGRGN